MNGRKGDLKKDKNTLRKQVTADTSHMTFCKEASSILASNFRFVDVKTTKKLKFRNFSPRIINQDPLEIFFGMIRSYGWRNINPTPVQFQNSFKSLLINNLTCAKTVRGNCEDDYATPLFSLRNMALIAQNAEDNDGCTNET